MAGTLSSQALQSAVRYSSFISHYAVMYACDGAPAKKGLD